MDYLPLVMLGRRTSLQPDIGASPSELTFGTNVRIPGQVLFDPQECDGPGLQDLLQKIKIKTSNPAVQPSSHCQPEKSLPPLPDNVTHVYTRQHQTTGLQTPYEGPFRIASRPSRSTVQIEVGVYKSGEKRYEIRHLNDLRVAHPDSFASPMARPKLGRPPKATALTGSPNQTDANNDNTRVDRFDDTPPQSSVPPLPQPSLPVTESKQTLEGANFQTRQTRSTRNPNPKYVDAIWSASPFEIAWLNRAIGA